MTGAEDMLPVSFSSYGGMNWYDDVIDLCPFMNQYHAKEEKNWVPILDECDNYLNKQVLDVRN